MWHYRGQQRPDFAITPGPGQESVWDYPRPPALVDCTQQVVVRAGDELIAQSQHCKRVLETASPPTYYLPPDAIRLDQLQPAPGASYCEWKGSAQYWALTAAPDTAVGWSYPQPSAAFQAIAGWLCFYPARIACFVDDERVRGQHGGFYGGWVTDTIVGPYKGEPGTGGW